VCPASYVRSGASRRLVARLATPPDPPTTVEARHVTAVEHDALGRPRDATSGSARGASRRATGRVGVRVRLRAWAALMKLRVVELLLATTLPTMVLAQHGLPPLGLVLATLLGGTLAAGSAHTLNQYLERDIDAVMVRTGHRPLASGLVRPAEGLALGLVLLVLAEAVLLAFTTPLAALLTLAANAFYVVVYTVLLKRRTAQNIVWGGAAGCMPVLIGWAAVTGSLDWAPVLLFLVVFFWTPPHYWPLALRFRDDYARAGVPMLPVVAPARVVARRVVAYSWAMVVVSLLVWPVAPTGWLYPVVAAGAGAWFLREAHGLLRRTVVAGPGADLALLRPMRLFHGSISYLAVVFLAVALDPLLLR
jgi:heme o synthase